jgi:hypothetical protein
MIRQRIVMNADYCCGFPLSIVDEDGHRQVRNPASLPISEALIAGLADWKDRFDETLNQQYPPESGFGSPDAEDEFYADGLRLAAALAIELLDSHLVEYHDDRYPVGERELHLLRDGAVVMRDGRLILPSHWLDLTAEPDRGQGLLAQFEREVAAGHVLEGKSLELLARCTICDDIVLHVRDDGYAVVHLREQAPEFPWTDLHHDRAALLADLSERHPWRMSEA